MKQQFSDTAHQAAQTSDHWERGNKQGELYDCPRLLPGNIFQAAAQGKGNLVKSAISWNWWDNRIGKPKWLEFTGKDTREKREPEREPEPERERERGKEKERELSRGLQRFPLKPVIEYWLVHAHEETVQGRK